jgi:hypothetical protein
VASRFGLCAENMGRCRSAHTYCPVLLPVSVWPARPVGRQRERARFLVQADHRLFRIIWALVRFQQRARPSGGLSSTSAAPGRCFLLESALPSALLVAVAEAANGLGSERARFCDLGSADVLSQLQQREGARTTRTC